MRPDYVDLNRTFFETDENEVDSESRALRSYLLSTQGELNWSKLLQSQFIVILGEPGSGKTWEMEARSEKLQNESGNAFFIRIVLNEKQIVKVEWINTVKNIMVPHILVG